MSWSKGSDVQRELARKHARQLMTAFDEVMKRETPEPVAVGAAVADLLSGYLVGWVDPESDDAPAAGDFGCRGAPDGEEGEGAAGEAGGGNLWRDARDVRRRAALFRPALGRETAAAAHTYATRGHDRRTSRAPPGTKAQPLASSADATHDLLPLGFSACEFFVRQLLLARGSRIVELPLSSFVFNRGGRR